MSNWIDSSVTSQHDEQPQVSIIMIFYNGERFIDEAIRSVRSQRYPHWELLLVDDGSTDDSSRIAKQHMQDDPSRIRYFRHPNDQNRGMSASRNVGLQHARGDLIAFLDADDVWGPNQVAQQTGQLVAHSEVDAVYGCMRYWHSWMGNPDPTPRDYVTSPPFPSGTVVRPPDGILSLARARFFGICSIMVRRELIERVGGFEADFRNLHEDSVFHAKVFLNGAVLVSDACWGWYRQHKDSTCRQSVRSVRWRIGEDLRYAYWLRAYLEAQGVQNDEVSEMTNRLAAGSSTWLGYAIRNPIRVLVPLLPQGIQNWLRPRWRRLKQRPPIGRIDFGDLRRTDPISGDFGSDRGTSIDRYYIERFLALHSEDIKGRVLEIGDNVYTRQFGGGNVLESDILHVHAGNSKATFVDDLAVGDSLPAGAFDCIILTQTLQLIYDVPAAIRTLVRILKPSGVVLATFPGLSQIPECEWSDSWYWGFTSRSAKRLFCESFPRENVEVSVSGNVLTSAGFLFGISAEELEQFELEHEDADYELVIMLRAVKPSSPSVTDLLSREIAQEQV